MMKTCSVFQRGPLGFQALCYLETDRNIIRQQKHPIYVFNNIRKRSVLWEYCAVLGGCYVIPHHMVKALAQNTELTDFLPLAPLLNQISFLKMQHLKAPSHV